MTGRVVTVLGEVPSSSLGRTLTHEHLSMSFECCYVAPKVRSNSKLAWTLENSGFIRQNPYSHDSNIILNDPSGEQAVVDSVKAFAAAGGGCLVENSVHGLNRKDDFVRRVSKETGVHVVAGTGYYVVASQDADTLAVSQEDMAAFMVSELEEGCATVPEVKCGFIGEIGCTWPLHDFERQAIRAAAAVQESKGCAVSFHPGRHPDAPFEIMRIFTEAGGRADKTIMSHLERTILDNGTLSEFAKLGSYCQFDLFGIENSYYQLAEHIDYPSDAQRMDYIAHLVKEDKLEDRILVAHDIHTKHRLERFGGHGFKHILEYVAPKLVAQKDFTQEQVDKILIGNPARALEF